MPSSELGAVPEDFAQFKLAPGFLVGLKVLDDSDFEGTFASISRAHCLTCSRHCSRRGRNRLGSKRTNQESARGGTDYERSAGYLNVIEYTAPQVTIIGEVGSPGKYPLLVPRKLVDVLALAGGPSVLAGNEVQIIPGNEGAKPALVHYSRNDGS